MLLEVLKTPLLFYGSFYFGEVYKNRSQSTRTTLYQALIAFNRFMIWILMQLCNFSHPYFVVVSSFLFLFSFFRSYTHLYSQTVAEPEFEFRGGKIKNIRLEAKFIKDISSSNTTLLIVNYELYQTIVYKQDSLSFFCFSLFCSLKY